MEGRNYGLTSITIRVFAWDRKRSQEAQSGKMAALPVFLETPRSESTTELHRLSDRRLSAKLAPTFADRGVSRSQRADLPWP
jgi:hypothetical protein